MHRKKTILAIIMARGGSKRLPRKNLKYSAGKPLIAWTIEAAKQSKTIDRVLVSTDSDEIACVAKRYGADVPFKRPAALASDQADSVDVAIHVMEWLKKAEGRQYDYLVQLQPTSPLRTSAQIDAAVKQAIGDPALDALASFYPWEKKPAWVFACDPSGFFKPCLSTTSPFKGTGEFFIPNGALSIIKVNVLLQKKTFYPERLKGFPMTREDSVDIDTQYDFDIAEDALRKKIKKETLILGEHSIKEGGRVFVIAEAGVNHNGRLDLALKLIDVAADIGADAIKFQTFKAHQVVTKTGAMAEYQKKNLGIEKTQMEMLRAIEMPEHFYPPLIKRCREKNILFLSTPHGGRQSVDFLESINMPIYKIGSGDLTNYLLLDRVAKTGKPIILSTGMATLQEVQDALEFIKSCGSSKVIVLHCTSNYPCPAEEVNLAAMKTLMRALPVPVGYSDHTKGDQAAIMAGALGAAVYEFHFTLDKTLPGPDHIASADPAEAAQKIQAIRTVEVMMGSSIKGPTLSEKKSMLKAARRSLVASVDLKKGHRLTLKDLEAKRPGDGISPIHFEEWIGKKLSGAIKKDQPFKPKDITV